MGRTLAEHYAQGASAVLLDLHFSAAWKAEKVDLGKYSKKTFSANLRVPKKPKGLDTFLGRIQTEAKEAAERAPHVPVVLGRPRKVIYCPPSGGGLLRPVTQPAV